VFELDVAEQHLNAAQIGARAARAGPSMSRTAGSSLGGYGISMNISSTPSDLTAAQMGAPVVTLRSTRRATLNASSKVAENQRICALCAGRDNRHKGEGIAL